MRRVSLVFALTALALLTLPLLAQKSTVTVKNLSDWTIEEFYMSPYDDEDWGDDLLGDEIMETGDTLTLTNISCDDWDLYFIDEDGDECVLEAVDLCGDRAEWNITNDELLNCVVESE